jgi:hypothetical protein
MPVTGSDRIERHADFILAAVAVTSDITLAELRAELIEERGETTTIWRDPRRRRRAGRSRRCPQRGIAAILRFRTWRNPTTVETARRLGGILHEF